MKLRFNDSLLVWLGLIVVGVAGCAAMRPTPRPPFAGFPSEEALLDEFVAAVGAKDKIALDQLRVTATEYRDVIIPGSVPVGKTMQGPLTETKFNYFWSMLNTKSRDYAVVILNDFGGHNWRRTRHWHTKEPQQFTGYRGLGEVRIAVVDDAGLTATVRTGFIADVAGQYKFIGFEYDSD